MDKMLESLYLDILEQNYGKIKKFCAYHLHRNPLLIEDCCQEVFRLYLEALIKGREIKNTGAWLRKVAYTEVLRAEKDAAKRMNLEWTEKSDEDVIDNQLVAECDYIEEIVKRKFSDDKLIQMVSETLSEDEKYIFDCCFINPRPLEALAQELHINVNNLYQKKCILKKKLLTKIPEFISEVQDMALKL